ncbi:MAG: hypothetical protein KA144_00940 [Xanthomonadaceae bacterium]|nr:hypothetical protein [Xanthomonadaceae bacterium]
MFVILPCHAADGWWPYPTQPFFSPSAFSRDGSLIVGGSGNAAAYSVRATGEVIQIGTFTPPVSPTPWAAYFTAAGSDSNGRPTMSGIAYGNCTDRNGCARLGFRWSAATGFVALDNPYSPLLGTIATDISANGAIVVGAVQQIRANGSPEGVPPPSVLLVRGWEAAIWDQSNTLRRLGFLSGGGMSVANATSANGEIVVGTADLGYANGQTGAVAFRWTAASGMVSLGTVAGDYLSYGVDVSGDGDVVVGASRLTYLPDNICCIPATRDVAFRWTSATGMQALGYLPNLNNSVATAVSDDGRVVVGYGFAIDAVGNPVDFSSVAFRWNAAEGMQSVSQWLTAAGVSLPSGLVLSYASDTDRTGETLIGTGRYEGQASSRVSWIAYVGERGSGLLTDLEAYRHGLGESSSRFAGSAQSLPSTALGGSHRRTLFDRGVDGEGHGCAWASADVDVVDEHQRRQQWFEVGACRDLGQWRLGLGLSGGSDRATFGMGSSLRTTNHHLSAELATRIGSRLEADAQATYGEFDLRETHRYADATGIDTSWGVGRGHYEALRARMFARDLWTIGSAKLTPYASVAHVRSALRPFAETQGSFPANYSGARWVSSEATLGLSTTLRAGADTTITPSLEFGHRLAESDTPLLADMNGVLGTTLVQSDQDRDWAGLAIDVDRRIGERSNLRLSLTANSRDATSIGIGALYGVRF